MTKEVSDALKQIGHGMRLAIPRPGTAGSPMLIGTSPFSLAHDYHDVPEATAEELISVTGLLCEMAELTDHAKVGWREHGLPGERYRLYSMMQ